MLSSLVGSEMCIRDRGNTSLERGAAVIKESLEAVGLGVDVVALEVGALVQRLEGGDFDAIYFRFLTTDTDPAMALDFWLCLLYTSDAADDLLCVDLGGRRSLTKKNKQSMNSQSTYHTNYHSD